MSITAETAKEHAKDPAVLCCRAEGGITIQAANLEDPAIFDDLVDSGLLKLDGTLTIEQVLGAKLVKTCDSLTPLTADLVEGAKAPAAEEEPAEEAKEEVKEEAPAVTANPTASVQKVGGVLKIHIGEGKDIDIEMPMGFNNGVAVAEVPAEVELPAGVVSGAAPTKELEPKVVRSVTRKHYKITEVKRGPETKIEALLEKGMHYLKLYAMRITKNRKVQVIGPAAPAVGKVKDVYRKVLYLKQESYEILIEMKDKMEQYIELNRGFAKMRIQFDFDPMSGF